MLTDFTRNEDGTVAVIVALMLTVLLGFAAIGVDMASLYRERAKLQGASDLTALSAMAAPENAAQRSGQALQRNGREAQSLQSLQMGRFLRNPALAPQDRFQDLPAGSAGINALRVVVQDEAALHFSQIFTDDTHITLSRRAMASRTGAASFSLDSHLVGLNNTALNDLLVQRFDTSAELSANDIDVLADTSVDLGTLLEALNIPPTRNPAEILNETTTDHNILAALQAILPAPTANRLANIQAAAGTDAFAISSLVGGIDTDLGLTVTDFLSEVDVSALDIVKAVLRVELAGEAVNINAPTNIAGVLDTQLTLTAGEPPARSGWIAMGETGVQLNRAAARLRAEMTLTPEALSVARAGIEIAAINLPIYTELAGATATLDHLSCRSDDPDTVAARFLTSATPLHPANGTSVAALYLGNLPQTDGAINPGDLEFADLLDVNIVIPLPLLPDIIIEGLTIQARSHVAVGASQVDTISFTANDIATGATTQSFGSGELLSSALEGLLSPANTEFRIKPGSGEAIPTGALSLVTGLLGDLPQLVQSELLMPIENVLDASLASAGLELGAGKLTLEAHHCETIRLVR